MNFIHSFPLWAELISLAFCIGTLVCRLWVPSHAPLSAILDHNRLLSRMWFLFGIAVAVILAGSAADLISRTAEMSGRPIMAAFPLIPAVILKSHFVALFGQVSHKGEVLLFEFMVEVW